MAPAVLLLLAAAACALAACSAGEGEDEPQPAVEGQAITEEWYNQPFLRAIWGDFDPAPALLAAALEQRNVLVARGAYLVKGPAACGSCHGAQPVDPQSPLTGGRELEDRFGLVAAANITPHPESGIGRWNVGDVKRALRSGIGKDGTALSPDLHQQYRWMSDADAAAVAVYLFSLPAAGAAVERRKLGGFSRKRWGIFSQHDEVEGYVPALPEKPIPQYGRYLTRNIAGCAVCHTAPDDKLFSSPEDFGGRENRASGGFFSIFTRMFRAEQSAEENSAAKLGPFPPAGPDIRGTSPTGLAQWKIEDMTEYLSTGRTPDGRRSNPRLCPWPYFSNAAAADKLAVARYLKQQ